MNLPDIPLDTAGKLTPLTVNTPHRAALDALGGEALEGSGFENEPPEPGFQFDWTQLKEEPEGGLR